METSRLAIYGHSTQSEVHAVDMYSLIRFGQKEERDKRSWKEMNHTQENPNRQTAANCSSVTLMQQQYDQHGQVQTNKQ
jgi:hypothetical protein